MSNAEMHLKAGHGIATLSQRIKFLAQEHRERIKRLRKLQEELQMAEAKRATQPDLVPVAASVAPEVRDLVMNPLHGL
jgi:hypothetical protein